MGNARFLCQMCLTRWCLLEGHTQSSCAVMAKPRLSVAILMVNVKSHLSTAGFEEEPCDDRR